MARRFSLISSRLIMLVGLFFIAAPFVVTIAPHAHAASATATGASATPEDTAPSPAPTDSAPEIVAPAPSREVTSGPVVLPAPAPTDPTDMGKLLTLLIEAIRARNWPLVIALLVVASVAACRAFGGRIHPWFESRQAGVALAVVTAGAGTVLAQLLAGQPWDLTMFGSAVTAALAAMGVVSGYRALKKGGTSEKHAAKQGARLVAKAIRAEKKGA